MFFYNFILFNLLIIKINIKSKPKKLFAISLKKLLDKWQFIALHFINLYLCN